MIHRQKKKYASNKCTVQLINPKWAQSCNHHPHRAIECYQYHMDLLRTPPEPLTSSLGHYESPCCEQFCSYLLSPYAHFSVGFMSSSWIAGCCHSTLLCDAKQFFKVVIALYTWPVVHRFPRVPHSCSCLVLSSWWLCSNPCEFKFVFSGFLRRLNAI